MYYHWGWGFGLFGFVIMLVIIWLVVRAAVDSNFDRNYTRKKSSSALDILNERYARGEISKDEYERMKNDIMS